jgi:hypothetical protein
LDKANFLYGAFTSSNASFTMITPLIVSIQRLGFGRFKNGGLFALKLYMRSIPLQEKE